MESKGIGRLFEGAVPLGEGISPRQKCKNIQFTCSGGPLASGIEHRVLVRCTGVAHTERLRENVRGDHQDTTEEYTWKRLPFSV